MIAELAHPAVGGKTGEAVNYRGQSVTRASLGLLNGIRDRV